MRRIVLSLVSAAALTLAGCNAPSPTVTTDGAAPASANTSNGQGNGTAAPAAISDHIDGTVTLREPAQLSNNARLDIRLVDITAGAASAGQALASKTVMPATQFPQQFHLTFDPAQVQANDLYVLQAEMVDGERHYVMKIQAPVLTKGRPDTVAVELVAEQTAGEKMLAAFDDVEEQLGAMKISHGTKLETNDSRSWQLFREGGELRLIRELVDYNGKSFTTTDYAYRDGKPWVIVQQSKPSQDAKTTATDRAGWDETGTLVLTQHQTGSDIKPLAEGAANKLKQQALDILSLATKGKNK